MMKMLSNRIPKLKFLSRIGIVAGLIVGLMFVSMFGSIASASISIGDDVKVTTNLNVRTGPGTGHPEIIDPDYPGYAPTGTMGITLSGPSSANGYTWWEVDYGPGLYSGWSVEGGLEKVQTAIDLTVISVNAPTSAEPGGYIAVSWTVKNQGDAPSGSFYNRVSLATAPYGTDISLGNFPMNSIASGSSLSDAQVPKIPETISPRYYYVTVFTDAFQSITESNEYNNINKATYQIHITGCECTSGPCCDGCNFRPSSYVCDSQYQNEYGCPWGTECGDDVGVRYKERYCSGSSSSCSGSISSWGSWQVADYCGDTETCSPRDSTCNYDLSCVGCSASECEYNSQCYSSGTCHPSISKQKCSNGNWINSCGDGNCNCGENSGNCPSDCCTPHYTHSCYNNDVYWYDSCGNRDDKKEECESDSCGSWGSNYCGTDGNVYHSRTCHDRGCSGLSCFDNTYTEEVKVQDCNDGNACTSDSCSGGSCVYTPITSCTSGDGCCPSGCNSINDNDCSVNCGNGICESGENCGNCLADCPCPSGEICCSGSCTTPPCSLNSDCNDYNSCTIDICNSAGTCSASCSNNPITSCINNDGCCPSGCDSINDNDCSVDCGNGVCDSGENCDNCLADCPCPSGQSCISGNCTTTCTNECSPSGTKTCTDSTHYKTCGDYDYDSCLEWSSVYSCPSGETCVSGSCQPVTIPSPSQCDNSAKPIPMNDAVRYALDAGFDKDNAIIIVAIAWAESGGNPYACYYNCGKNPSWDRGILQINSYWHSEVTDSEAFNPTTAFRVAFRIYKVRGFKEWVTYKNNTYKNYLAATKKAVNQASSQDQDIQIGDWANKATNLAEQVIGAPYLGDGYNWGGKGWNWNPNGGWKWNEGRFVEPNEIKSGYYYYHSVDGKVKFEKGLDCSGLVFWAYGKTLGLDYYKATQEIGEGANTQYNKFHNPTITKDNLKPGDLLFFTSHVGMYVGDGRVVHSKLSKGKVVEEPLEDVLKIGGFKGYGRVKQSTQTPTEDSTKPAPQNPPEIQPEKTPPKEPKQNPIQEVLEKIQDIIDKILSRFGF